MPGKNASWPQKGLLSPESPPISQAEARERLKVLVEIAELDRLESKMQLKRRFLVERLQQLPENN